MAVIDLMEEENIPDGMTEKPLIFPDFTEVLEEFPDTGLAGCVWDANLTYLFAHKDSLIARFNQQYVHREIGQETPFKFNTFVQRRLILIQNKYNYMYKMYETNQLELLGINNESESTIENEVTPDTQYVSTDKYLESRITETTKQNNRTNDNLSLVNKNMDNYIDLDRAFVDEFSNLFSSILYIGTFDSEGF